MFVMTIIMFVIIFANKIKYLTNNGLAEIALMNSFFRLNLPKSRIMGFIMGCPFCDIDSDRVHLESKHFKVFRDGYPVSPGHTLIAPKRHVESLFDLNDAEKKDFWSVIELASTELNSIMSPDGYNLGINDGVDAGRTVHHLHMHLIPRYKGDQKDPRGGVRWIFPDKAKYWT